MWFTAEQRAHDSIFDPVWRGNSTSGELNGDSAAKSRAGIDISGTHRFLYFEKPCLMHEEWPGPEIKLVAKPEPEAWRRQVQEERQRSQPKSKTVGVPTQYRDSEAQTDPYSPEYVAKEGDTLELLLLAKMTYANGQLPASEREIARIVREWERREEESALPPITNEETLLMHKEFLERQEKLDFGLREKELDAEMEEKLAKFRQSLEEKDARAESLIEERLKAFSKSREEEMAARVKKKQAAMQATGRGQACSTGIRQPRRDVVSLPEPRTRSEEVEHDPHPALQTVTNPHQGRPIAANNRQVQALAADLELIDGIFKREDAKTKS